MPNLWGILLHYFIQKKSAAEPHRIIVENYGYHALLEATYNCKNNDFDVEDKECSGTPKKFENEYLEILLHEDSCQVQAELAKSLSVDHATVSKHLKALGMIRKQGHWLPYKLKPRDVEQHLVMCEQRLQQLKKKVFCIML